MKKQVDASKQRYPTPEVNKNAFEVLSEDEDEDEAKFGANSSSSNSKTVLVFLRHA